MSKLIVSLCGGAILSCTLGVVGLIPIAAYQEIKYRYNTYQKHKILHRIEQLKNDLVKISDRLEKQKLVYKVRDKN